MIPIHTHTHTHTHTQIYIYIYIFTAYLPTILFNIIFPSIPTFPMWFLCLDVKGSSCVQTSSLYIPWLPISKTLFSNNTRYSPLFSMFTKLWTATISYVTSVRPHEATWLPLDRFSLNLVSEYCSKICEENHTRITGTSFWKSCHLRDNAKKYGAARQATGDNIIWCMHFACQITKGTDTHSEYVILCSFLSQQWLHERVCYIYMCTDCLIIILILTKVRHLSEITTYNRPALRKTSYSLFHDRK
jgi:hypothetical protein